MTEEVRFYEDVAGVTGLGDGALAALRSAGLDAERRRAGGGGRA